MKTITVGFSKSRKPLAVGSWIIRAYQRTPYSHVYLKFHSTSLNRDLIYEAVGSGVRFIGEKQWAKHAEEVASFSIQITDDQYVSLLQYCVDNSGVEYGFLQNIGIPLSKLLHLNSNPFQSGHNCAEELHPILNSVGYSIPIKKDLVTPKDIYQALSK